MTLALKLSSLRISHFACRAISPHGPFVELLFRLMRPSCSSLELGDHRVTSNLAELGVQGILGEAGGNPSGPTAQGRSSRRPRCHPPALLSGGCASGGLLQIPDSEAAVCLSLSQEGLSSWTLGWPVAFLPERTLREQDPVFLGAVVLLCPLRGWEDV